MSIFDVTQRIHDKSRFAGIVGPFDPWDWEQYASRMGNELMMIIFVISPSVMIVVESYIEADEIQ